jgi:hypothetical protein
MPRERARIPARIKAVRCLDSSLDRLSPEPGAQPRWTEAWAICRAPTRGAEARCLDVQGHRLFRLRGTARLRKTSPATGRPGPEQPLGTPPGYRVMRPARMAAV